MRYRTFNDKWILGLILGALVLLGSLVLTTPGLAQAEEPAVLA